MRSMKKIFRPRSPRNPISYHSTGWLRQHVPTRLICFAALLFASCAAALAQSKPSQDYLVYVLSEGADRISLIRFGPGGARLEHDTPTGDMPIDIDGPHGIVVSRDKQFYYVSLAHGRPFGSVWKYATKDDRVIGQTRLGLFPATMDV